MDGMQTYWTIKEVMAFLRRSRAQVDRYRKLAGFPEAIVPSGTENGGVLYLRAEIFDWSRNRPRRILRPPADDLQ
jgi:hypothetical protein